MREPPRTPPHRTLVTLLVAALFAGGCGKKNDSAERKGGARTTAPEPSVRRQASSLPSRAAPRDAAMAPARPARPAPLPRLAPLPWPPPKLLAPKLRATCKSLCGTREKGDFFDKCSCKGRGVRSPLAARRTPEYNDFFKRYEFEVINRSDRPVSWASANLYYYDATGKQLSVVIKDPAGKAPPRTWARYRVNGSNFTVAAATTRKITLGWSREEEPRGTARVEVVFDGWCYGERHKKTHKEINRLCVRIGAPPEQRPMTRLDAIRLLMGRPDGPGVQGLGLPPVPLRATVSARHVDGPIAPIFVKAAIKKHLPALARCCQPTLGGPRLPGTLKVTLDIAPDGKVTRAKRAGGTIDHGGAVSCAVRLLGSMRVQAVANHPTVTSITLNVAPAPPKK